MSARTNPKTGYCWTRSASGEDSSEVQIIVLNAVELGTSRDILEGRHEVKGNQHSSGICFSKILGGLDHGVGIVRS